MRLLSLLAGMTTLWAWSAAAYERTSLTGYQEFKFGITEADVRARIKVTGEARNKDGGVWLSSTETNQLGGQTYMLDFRIRDGLLVAVALSRSLAVSPPECEEEFLNVIGLLQAKYGEADRLPDIVRYPDSSSYGFVDITFSDAGSISVDASAKPQDCDLQVAYVSAAGNRTQ